MAPYGTGSAVPGALEVQLFPGVGVKYKLTALAVFKGRLYYALWLGWAYLAKKKCNRHNHAHRNRLKILH
jgi:hypothetical protein